MHPPRHALYPQHTHTVSWATVSRLVTNGRPAGYRGTAEAMLRVTCNQIAAAANGVGRRRLSVAAGHSKAGPLYGCS